MARRSRWLLLASIATVVVVLGALSALSSGGGTDASGPSEDEFTERVSGVGPPRAIPGFEPCEPDLSMTELDPSMTGCEGIVVNLDFYARVTGDPSVKYPADYGLPECPPPSPDPGFEPGESADVDELSNAPGCAVHPRYGEVTLYMVSEDAAAFQAEYGCGGEGLSPCRAADA